MCVSSSVHDGGEAVVVDPAQYVDEYLGAVDGHNLLIVGVADMHAHADHVSGAGRLAGDVDVPYYRHGADAGELDSVHELEDGDALNVGDRELDVLHTPGHTPGSVSFAFDDPLLSGDTLFLRSIWRSDLDDSDEAAVLHRIVRSFARLPYGGSTSRLVSIAST